MLQEQVISLCSSRLMITPPPPAAPGLSFDAPLKNNLKSLLSFLQMSNGVESILNSQISCHRMTAFGMASQSMKDYNQSDSSGFKGILFLGSALCNSFKNVLVPFQPYFPDYKFGKSQPTEIESRFLLESPRSWRARGWNQEGLWLQTTGLLSSPRFPPRRGNLRTSALRFLCFLSIGGIGKDRRSLVFLDYHLWGHSHEPGSRQTYHGHLE